MFTASKQPQQPRWLSNILCWHVFGKISSEFRGISRVLVNFAGFHGFSWNSRLRDSAKYQKPCLKRKKIFQKGKRHSSLLWKAFQMSSNYFLLHRHFKEKKISIKRRHKTIVKTFRQLRNHYFSPASPFSISKSFSCTFVFLLPDLVPLKQTRAVRRKAKDTFVLIHVIVVA